MTSDLPSQAARRRDVILLLSSYPLGTWALHQALGDSTWLVAAYLDAYRVVSASAVLGTIWIAIGVDKGLWWIPRTYNEWNYVFWGLFILTTSLPAAFLSWREPDRAHEADAESVKGAFSDA